MNYQVIKAPDDLKEIVRSFWILENDQKGVMPKLYQSMADESAELVLPYGGGFVEVNATQLYLRAQKSSFKSYTLADNFGMLGARLFPHALPELLGIDASELCNKTLDARALFGKEIDEVSDRMHATTSPMEKIEILSHFLRKLSLKRKVDPINQLVKGIMQQEGIINLKEFLYRSGFSQKHFERRFKSSTGFSPKHFSRIVRYHSTKRRYATGRYRTLSELAQASGYCDQSYFIREFKEFAGWHPSRYFNIISDSSNEEGKLIKGLIVAKDRYQSLMNND
ncbi:MAG: helix-turn-helix domain-containing protein [Chryseolinea sp.]